MDWMQYTVIFIVTGVIWILCQIVILQEMY
jgi:hypothetical protein